jgi:hypothetical protein
MTTSRSFTPYILAAFFAVILLALVAASAWSHEHAIEAAQADATDTYVSVDDEAPVTDAVIEKATT